jgi:COP9 signalosome complex subunit 5
MTNQRYQDPFVAVVIDPNRTISAGKVDIGAFRTYPEDYKPPSTGKADEYQSIPLSKIEDFGVHANSYYPLDVQIFKSSLDDRLLGLLWNKYWVNTLSQSPLISVCQILRYNFHILINTWYLLGIESCICGIATTGSTGEAE